MATLDPVEAAGWIPLSTAKSVLAFCQREGVDPDRVYTRFGVRHISELQTEDLFGALVFIGKNSKE